ncbi:MAG: dihydroorotate dehydrogenase [Nitriliruptoraceae bacterium]|nr:dihydroorotate dehydrogenase [Nitriliruptoraceae bacterium]
MSSDVRRLDPAEVAGHGADRAEVDLSTDLAGLALPDPILTASGCFASGREMDRFYDVDRIAAVVVKSITREPRRGLPTPRMAETPSGMLNAIGLQNPGVDAWVAHDLPWLAERGVRVVASIAGKSVADYRAVAEALRAADPEAATIRAFEVNLSCPNVEDRGLVFACDPSVAAEVIRGVRSVAHVPMLAKLTSDVTDIVAVARAVVEAGADGLTLINTVLGMVIDPETGRPALSNTYGGLSGPAIRPIAVRNVHQVHTAMPEVPILGCGGVREATDVIQFLRAGASAVSVGTSTFVDPFIGPTLVEELRTWCAQRGIATVRELIGTCTPWEA